jgi:hypothetical protein
MPIQPSAVKSAGGFIKQVLSKNRGKRAVDRFGVK